MCGLILVRTSGPSASKIAIKRYEHQKARGRQGFGYIALKDGYVKEVVRATTEEEIMAKLRNETSNEIMFHHRLPTSTENVIEATHPIVIKSDMFKHDYYMIHNGVISGPDTDKKHHNSMGFSYSTEHTIKTVTKKIVTFANGRVEENEFSSSEITKFNDSEALAYDLALVIEGLQDEMQVTGSIAFIMYQTDKEGKVLNTFYGQNGGRSLKVETINPRDTKKGKKTPSLFILKSEGSGVDVMSHALHKMDHETGELTVTKMNIGKVFSTHPRTTGTGSSEEKSNNQGGDNGAYGFGRWKNERAENIYSKDEDKYSVSKIFGKDDEREANFTKDHHNNDSLIEFNYIQTEYDKLDARKEELEQKMYDLHDEYLQWRKESMLQSKSSSERNEAASIALQLRSERQAVMKELDEVLESMYLIEGQSIRGYSAQDLLDEYINAPISYQGPKASNTTLSYKTEV